MAGNWWDQRIFGDDVALTVGDVGLSIIPGYAYYAAAKAATGDFGRDDARSIEEGFARQDERDAETAARYKMDRIKDQKALAPYQQAGTDALAQQRALAGLDGPEAQAQAIAQLEQSPQFQSMIAQQERAILSNASATGGLRGGNTQQALAGNASDLLSQTIAQQMAQYQGLSQSGQQAAQFGVQAGQQNANMFGQLNQQRGQNEAGASIGRQGAISAGRRETINLGMDAFGTLGGLGLKAASRGVV
jgi:hypothetical protein